MTSNTDLRTLTDNPDKIKELPIASLQALWKKCCPRKKAHPIKSLLIRELAYVIQAQRYGDIDKCTLDTLHKIKPHTKKHKTSSPLLNGTILKRVFNGRTYTVEIKITDQQRHFLFQGQPYKSLSKIASLITGTHLSGPRFFGLQDKKKQ